MEIWTREQLSTLHIALRNGAEHSLYFDGKQYVIVMAGWADHNPSLGEKYSVDLVLEDVEGQEHSLSFERITP